MCGPSLLTLLMTPPFALMNIMDLFAVHSTRATLLQEIVAVVEAVGVAPSPEFVAAAKAGLIVPGSTQTSSMYRDLLRGVPIEVKSSAISLNVLAQPASRRRYPRQSTPIFASISAGVLA